MLTNVDKYLSRFAKKYGKSANGNSRYYQMDGGIIRVSDHIGRNSDGCVQIIVKPNGYILYSPSNGKVSICTYRQVQEFIRSFSVFPLAQTGPVNLVVSNDATTTVLGVPSAAFTDGQLMAIQKMVKKVKESAVK
ncbi:MAG: hypothetical protein J6X18_05565 [Bacteroidales bacterium]|nr:hypothetical protein [Bacteroidales bacterium]